MEPVITHGCFWFMQRVSRHEGGGGVGARPSCRRFTAAGCWIAGLGVGGWLLLTVLTYCVGAGRPLGSGSLTRPEETLSENRCCPNGQAEKITDASKSTKIQIVAK